MERIDSLILPAKIDIPIPIPMTTNMFVVLIAGGLLTWASSKAPGFLKRLSGLTAVGTIFLVVLVGYDDVTGGDLVQRVTKPQCVGWNPYVDSVDQLRVRYDGFLDQLNADTFGPSDARPLADDVSALTVALDKLTPPSAANEIHENLRSIFNETKVELTSYAIGRDFTATTINRLLDRQNVLVESANKACV